MTAIRGSLVSRRWRKEKATHSVAPPAPGSGPRRVKAR